MGFPDLLAVADRSALTRRSVMEGMMRCSVCGESKPTADFAPSFARRGSGPCRPCRAARRRAAYAADPAKARERTNTQRQAKPDAKRESDRKYRKHHAAQRRDYA